MNKYIIITNPEKKDLMITSVTGKNQKEAIYNGQIWANEWRFRKEMIAIKIGETDNEIL